jgi:signal transduction histidine kinase
MADVARPALIAPAYRPTLFDQILQRIVTGIVLLTIAFYVLVLFLASAWLQRPFVGAFIEKADLFNDVRSQGADAFPAFQAGVQPRDHLLAVDGAPVSNSAALAAVLAQHQPGDVVTLTVAREVRDAADETLTVSVALTRFTTGNLLNLFVAPYVLGLIYLIIGLWVFWVRRGEMAGRVFALFCAVAAAAMGMLFDLWTTHALTWAWTLAIPAAGGALFTLSLVFPQEIRFVQRYPVVRLLFFVPVFLLAGYAWYTLYAPGVPPRAYIDAWRYEYYYMGGGVVWFFGMMTYRAGFSPSPIAREQSRIILIGAVMGFSPILFWVIGPLLGLSIPFSVTLFLLPLIFFPLAVAYAILRYRLLETDVLLSQGLVYIIIGLLTAAAYGLILTGLGLIIGPGLRASHPLAMGLMIFVLVALFNPVRDRLQGVVDRAFFRGSRTSARQLEQFGRVLTSAATLDEIHRALADQIQSALRPQHFYLFLRDPANDDYGAFAEGNQPPPTDLRFAANSGLVMTLARERAALYLAPEVPLPSTLLSERVRLAVMGSAIYAPLPGQAGLVGWLAVGPKLSGEAFTRDDLRFIETLADQSALAVERATSISDLQRRVKELNVLSQMSQAVNFTLAYDDLLELIYAQTAKIVEARNIYVIMRDERTLSFVYVFYVENDERLHAQENKPWQVGRGLATEVARTGQPIRADDYTLECRRRNVQPRGKPLKAWMGVPLNTGAETIGVMSVASTDPNVQFNDEQLKVFWAIADQAASAIVKARLFRQTEERARQLASLNDVSASMASTLELDPLLKRIVQSSIAILQCEAGSLFLTDDETGESVFRVTEGPVGQNLLGLRIAPGKGFVGQAVESGQPIIVNDVQNDPRWFRGTDQQTGFLTRAMLVVPLRRGDKRIGAIQVLNKKDGTGFSEEDQALLTAFAGQAAVAIENARLFTQTDQQLAARVEELSVMQRIDRELNTALDVRRVMNITLNWAMRNTLASAGFVGIIIENMLSIVATQGYAENTGPFQSGGPLPLDTGLFGTVVASGNISLLREVRAHPDAQRHPLRPETHTLLILPIKREREVVGLMNLESAHAEAFNDEQVQFVTRLVDHASVAITNARLYAEVQAANLAKTEFVSFVAHELKNPMASIKGYTSLLLGGAVGAPNEMQTQFLDTIHRNVDRMAIIVSDLNDITQLETGRVRLELKDVAFQAILDEVIRTNRPLIDAKQQTLVVDAPADLPLVWADHKRTAQIFTNLVSNAYKYTPEGGQITLKVERSANHWDARGSPEVLHVAVTDTGIGISPDDQKKLFQKYYRTQEGKDMAPGTGLGLNIVKTLVELQGGQIWFESVSRQGSTFHFTLPLSTHRVEEPA